MKVVELQPNDQSNDFNTAQQRAREVAREELGDNMSLVFYNNDQKLVSNHGIRCKVKEKESCGAGSYARSFNADLEVLVGSYYKFYFRHVEGYQTVERLDSSLQFDINATGYL